MIHAGGLRPMTIASQKSQIPCVQGPASVPRYTPHTRAAARWRGPGHTGSPFRRELHRRFLSAAVLFGVVSTSIGAGQAPPEPSPNQPSLTAEERTRVEAEATG